MICKICYTMTPGKINNKGQARLFENDFLEMLTKTHPLIIWGMYLPVISYCLYIAEIRLSLSVLAFILLILFLRYPFLVVF